MGTLAFSILVALVLQAAPPPAPAASSQPPAASAPAATAPDQPPPPAPDNYTYSPDGRRDPFQSPIGAGAEPRGSGGARRGEGIAGMTVSEISVRGVMQSRGTLLAMVQGPDNRTYIVHPGDKFADGTVQSITPEGLAIVQEVNDPLSLVKQRVVRKPLRSVEDVKQ
jgi:type IV pilus assembly protein PilP